MKISRQAYAEMFGPTTGDRIRLADTALFARVEKDFTIYGEEVKFGGGKVIRDGMGQSQRMSADCVDTVLTNALIIDYWGIVKADIGIKAIYRWRDVTDQAVSAVDTRGAMKARIAGNWLQATKIPITARVERAG